MRPLFDAAMHQRLVAIRNTLPERGVSNIAHVFVPVGPNEGDPAAEKLRLLFVGRATRGYAEEPLASFDHAAARDMELVAEWTSPFWRFMDQVLDGCLERLGIHDTDRTHHVGWSNLAKIGDTKGNPTDLSLNFQKEECQAALRQEVALMKPHAIILTTGDYAWEEIAGPVFGDDDWRALTDPTWLLTSEEHSALVVSTYHPERKKGSREMAGRIAEAVSSHILEQSRKR